MLRVLDGGRQQHQPDDARGLEALGRLEDRKKRFGAEAVLGRLSGEVDLHQEVDGPSHLLGRPVERIEELAVVNGVDDVEELARLLRLVRLKVPDEVPAERQVLEFRDLPLSFLDFVLAEIDLAGRGGGSDVLGGKGFGDGDEADAGSVASGPAGSVRNAFANAGEPGAERRRVEHQQGYFGRLSANCFAVAAFGPEGASSRYFTNSPRAAAGFSPASVKPYM